MSWLSDFGEWTTDTVSTVGDMAKPIADTVSAIVTSQAQSETATAAERAKIASENNYKYLYIAGAVVAIAVVGALVLSRK